MNNSEELLLYYQSVYLIRRFEERVETLVSEGEIQGTIHLCIGQEAVPVGTYAALRDDDYAIGTHRSHGHILGKKTDIKKVMAELFGKKTGYCKGLGGTQHMAAFDKHFLGTNGITGGGIPVATGVALGLKLKKSDQVVICFMGDGAVNQGTFHESLNMASIWKLPVVFIIENNLYAMSTPVRDVVNITNLSERSQSYGFEGKTIDGNDVFLVRAAVEKAAEKARLGGGPTLIEAITYRQKGHSRSDPRTYRTRDEEKDWFKKDPLLKLENDLLSLGTKYQDDMDVIRNKVEGQVEEAIDFAKESDVLSFQEILS